MGVGLVEFATPDVAEKTREKMNGQAVGGQKICVSFCIPGISAAMMYGKLLMSNVRLLFGAIIKLAFSHVCEMYVLAYTVKFCMAKLDAFH